MTDIGVAKLFLTCCGLVAPSAGPGQGLRRSRTTRPVEGMTLDEFVLTVVALSSDDAFAFRASVQELRIASR